jgi:uncharacterized protein YhbP (UPF0306 family)
MSNIDIHFAHPNYSDQQLVDSISNILNTNTTLSMATVKGNESYINTVFYAYNSSLDLFIFTQPYTQHGQNIQSNPSIAIAIWTPPQVWGENLQGLQMFGTCERVKDEDLINAMHVFSERFSGFGQLIKDPADFEKGITESRLYVIKTYTLKLLDEPALGRRNYITLAFNGTR